MSNLTARRDELRQTLYRLFNSGIDEYRMGRKSNDTLVNEATTVVAQMLAEAEQRGAALVRAKVEALLKASAGDGKFVILGRLRAALADVPTPDTTRQPDPDAGPHPICVLRGCRCV